VVGVTGASVERQEGARMHNAHGGGGWGVEGRKGEEESDQSWSKEGV